MNKFAQLKKAIKEVEFSDDAEKKIGKILKKAKGGLKEKDKEELLATIRADIARDSIEAEGCRIFLGEINKLLAKTGK